MELRKLMNVYCQKFLHTSEFQKRAHDTLECHWLDNKRVSSEFQWLDDKRQTLAGHYYVRVVAKWLKFLVDYVRRPNLTVITSRNDFETIEGSVNSLESQIGDWQTNLDP